MTIVESTSDKAAGVVILTLTGRIDTATSDYVGQTLTSCIDRGVRRLVLDLGAVDYISSVGLRTLILAAKRLTPLGGRLGLCRLQPRIVQLFDIAGFTPLFPIAATVDEAAELLS